MFDHLGTLSLEKLREEIRLSLEEAEIPSMIENVREETTDVEFILNSTADLSIVNPEPEDETRLDGYVFLRLNRGVRWPHLMGRILMASELGGTFSGAYDANFNLLGMVYTVIQEDHIPMERVQLLFRAVDSLGRTEGVAIHSIANRVYVITHRRYEEWIRQLFAKDLRPENETRTIPRTDGQPLN